MVELQVIPECPLLKADLPMLCMDLVLNEVPMPAILSHYKLGDTFPLLAETDMFKAALQEAEELIKKYGKFYFKLTPLAITSLETMYAIAHSQDVDLSYSDKINALKYIINLKLEFDKNYIKNFSQNADFAEGTTGGSVLKVTLNHVNSTL